jgi:hypothetical protein
MDELFAALDALTRSKMQEELLQLWQDTRFTVLFVTPLDTIVGSRIGVVHKPLTLCQRLANQNWLRKTLILAIIAVAWETYARHLNNTLLVPTFSATVEALSAGIASGNIPQKVVNSVELLLKGYALGLVLALALTTTSMMFRYGTTSIVPPRCGTLHSICVDSSEAAKRLGTRLVST